MDLLVLRQILVALSLLLGMVLAVELGFQFGKHRKPRSAASAGMETGAIQGAMLGLLGLLLGFSFSGAANRYMERQDLITQEANAIGTAHLRAGLLNEPERSSLRNELATYVEDRLAASKTIQNGLSDELMANVKAAHERIWAAAEAGVLAKPSVTVAVLGPVNEVIDMHSLRVAAGFRHLPGLVLVLLVSCSLLALAVVGFALGFAGRRNPAMTTVLAVLVAAALWTTIDLDHSRIGFVRVSDAALEQLYLGDSP